MHEMTPERRQLSVSRPPASIENAVPSVARRLDELSRLVRAPPLLLLLLLLLLSLPCSSAGSPSFLTLTQHSMFYVCDGSMHRAIGCALKVTHANRACCTAPPPPLTTPQAVAANRHEVWTAAIEMRLAQLAEERRWREAAAEAIVAAKQRELEFLEQQQEVGQEEEQGRTPPSVQQPQRQAGAWAAGEDPSLPSPLASPLSRTG